MSTGNSGHSLPLSLPPEALSFRFARTTAGGVHETWVISTSGLRSASDCDKIDCDKIDCDKNGLNVLVGKQLMRPAFRLPDGRCVIPFPQIPDASHADKGGLSC